MGPTLLLVGTDQLPMVPEYLSLGTVVVIAPDRTTLESWLDTVRLQPSMGSSGEERTIVDLDGRRIVHDGSSLPLSDLEFRVLGALLQHPRRALSFSDLRRLGWGDGPELPVDPYSVKAVVQRIRAKLETVGVPVVIESVRGFGYRIADTCPATLVHLGIQRGNDRLAASPRIEGA